jgi:soluble lytic murein transglycosylase-like protein
VCALLAQGCPGPTCRGPSCPESRIQANSSPANEVRRVAPPRRSFLVALAASALLAAVEYTPSGALETPSLSAVIAAGGRESGARLAARPISLPVDSAVLEREVVSRYDYRPLARLLGRHNRNHQVVRRIARAIAREAERLQVAPSLLTGVLLTENPRLETTTVSSQGAIGLMQVMHFHAGEFDCASDDLRDVDSNICHGASVFGRYLKRTGNVKRALLRYNGCVVSANTPNCHRYPAKVIRAARQVRRDLLAYPGSDGRMVGGSDGRMVGGSDGQTVGRSDGRTID